MYNHVRPSRKRWKYRDERKWIRTATFFFLVLGTLSLVARFFSSTSRKELHIVDIPRIQVGTLSAKDFFDEFGDTTPVIIEGEVRHHPAYNMSFDKLKELCGNAVVETKVFDENSVSWGGLGGTQYMLLSDYVDNHILNYENKDNKDGKPRYLTYGLGLPRICPKLELFTPVPKYVSLSVYEIDREHYDATGGKRNQNTMPVMFMGNKNTKTEMHIDGSLSPFWMSVYVGSKTFRVITYKDAKWYLDLKNKRGWGNRILDGGRWERKKYNSTTRTADSRIMEIFRPDLEWFPELSSVTIYEGTVNAGDWIYLPSAALHGVLNNNVSWGVTVNALYPAVVDDHVSICADTGFKSNCYMYAAYSQCPFKELNLSPKKLSKRKLRRCLQSSSMLKDLELQLQDGLAREMHLHEIAGYDDYESWCKGQCSLYKSQTIEGFTQGLIGFNLAMYNHTLKETCAQCDYVLEEKKTEYKWNS